MQERIAYYLEEANKYGLLEEVMMSAIKHAQANPDYPMDVIMDMACDDWDIQLLFFAYLRSDNKYTDYRKDFTDAIQDCHRNC